MSTKNSNNNFVIIAILIALANLAVFGAMFAAMGYFELLGADQSYFDDGTLNNIKIIETILKPLGLSIDPITPHKITTLKYAICYGVALLSAGVCTFIALRKPSADYEVSEAKV